MTPILWAARGFIPGILFLIILDTLLPLHPDMSGHGSNEAEACRAS